MTAGGSTSWFGFAEKIFAESDRLGGPVARVVAIASADYPDSGGASAECVPRLCPDCQRSWRSACRPGKMVSARPSRAFSNAVQDGNDLGRERQGELHAQIHSGYSPAVMAMPVAALAHHGWGSYDASKVLTIKAPVVALSWQTPTSQSRSNMTVMTGRRHSRQYRACNAAA